jgi:hypothetical protein
MPLKAPVRKFCVVSSARRRDAGAIECGFYPGEGDRMNWIRNLIVTGVVVLATAVPARADIFLGPSVGGAMGGFVKDGAKTTYAGQLGILTDGPIGFELDYGYTKNIRDTVGSGNFRTIGGALLYVPGFLGGAKVRGYVSAGGGQIAAVSKFSHLLSGGSDEVESAGMVSAGAGLFGFVSEKFGIRVDVRYIRALLDEEAAGPDSPHFIRATAGLVIKF